MEQTANQQQKTAPGRPFKPGQSGNPKGRPKMTQEQKEVKKATRELIEDYKRKLAEALPEISPALIAKARSGDVSAIKEINDRLMGKPREMVDIGVRPKMVILDNE